MYHKHSHKHSEKKDKQNYLLILGVAQIKLRQAYMYKALLVWSIADGILWLQIYFRKKKKKGGREEEERKNSLPNSCILIGYVNNCYIIY